MIDPIDAEGPVAKLEEKIRRVLEAARGEWMSESELKRKVNYSRCGLDKFTRAIQNLKSAGEIEFDSNRGYRRKVTK